MKSSKLKYVAVLITIAVIGGLLTYLLMHDDREGGDAQVSSGDTPKYVKQTSKKLPPKVRLKPAVKASHAKPVIEIEDEDELPPEEKALKNNIENAVDNDDLRAALSCAEAAHACTNAEIRQAMVDALGWFGEKALPELSLFLADPDEDVRDSARNEWSMAVSEIEDEKTKINAVEMVMSVINDEDFLENITSEYIGVDEKLAVESLVRIIADDKCSAGVAKAKETYEFVTGDEWISEQEAARWIAEEYKPEF